MLRALWLAEGRAPVPADAIPGELWDALAEEADQLAPNRILRDRTVPGLQVLRDGSITSPQRCHVHPGGPALVELVRHPAVVAVACEATGNASMTAIRYGYKWYTPRDHMQVHRDEGKCEITFSAGLIGDLATMGWRPNLRWLTSAQVADMFADTSQWPADDKDFPIEHRRLCGFDGVRVPHWRPPYEADMGVMVTCCFAPLS